MINNSAHFDPNEKLQKLTFTLSTSGCAVSIDIG